MKKTILLLLLMFMVTGCDKGDGNEPGEVGLIDKPTKVFEALKGEWIWRSYSTIDTASAYKYDDNYPSKHTSIIHIISQNADSSINYKVYTNDSVCSDSVTFYEEGTFKTGLSLYQGEEIAVISSNITSHIEDPYDHLYCDIKGSNWYHGAIDHWDLIVIDANSVPIAHHYNRIAGPTTVAPFDDSLKGDWKWVKTNVGGIIGDIVDAEYPVTIQILSQNADSSINFKTFTNGTLLKEGSFMNKTVLSSCGLERLRIFDKNISHRGGSSDIGNLMYVLWNDTLMFQAQDSDNVEPPAYYYAKIK